MFEKAVREKVRFETTRGLLSVEDLWDLPLTKLNDLAKGLKRKLRSAEEEDFLDEAPVDNENQFKFDLVLHVLNVKKDENKAQRDASAKREEKQKLLEILARKKEQGLEELTEEELLARINSL